LHRTTDASSLRHVWSTELALCIHSKSTCSARTDCGGAAKFRRQPTDHLEQTAACTTSTRAVTERLGGAENAGQENAVLENAGLENAGLENTGRKMQGWKIQDRKNAALKMQDWKIQDPG